MNDVSQSTLTTWGQKFVEARDPISHDEDSDPDELIDLTETEKDLIDSFENEENATLAGYGESRIVFNLDSSRVVLFARNGAEEDDFTNGRLTNENEQHIFTRLTEHDMIEQFNLLPILDGHADNLWILKPNIRSVTESDTWVSEAWDEHGKENLWDNLQPLGDHIHLMEVQPANVCVWNGSFNLFDYGTSPPEIEED